MPESLRAEIEYLDHAAGAQQIEALFGSRRGCCATARAGPSRVHAPRHPQLHPRRRALALQLDIGGEPAQKIDELPLEWFFGPGVRPRHDRARPTARRSTSRDVEAELERIGHELGRSTSCWCAPAATRSTTSSTTSRAGRASRAEATHWLYDRGVRVMGIDAWGWDRPLHMQARRRSSATAGIFWEAHQADLEYSQIERLVNLDQLPPTGFKVACFPLRIVGGSAAPARVVAIVARTELAARDVREPPEVRHSWSGRLRAGRGSHVAVDPGGAHAEPLGRARCRT